MIHYSLNTDIRKKTYGILGVASAAIAGGATLFLQSVPLPFAAPSGLVVFGALAALFDRYAWRWPFVNDLLEIPILDGYWEGNVVRNGLDGKPPETRKVKMTVTQRWSTISIVFTGQSSTSHASVIAMNIADPKQISLRWVYDARDISGHPAKNRYGEGTTMLTLANSIGKRQLQGMYYSTKLSKGTISLTEIRNG